jgi:hypothetical protein
VHQLITGAHPLKSIFPLFLSKQTRHRIFLRVRALNLTEPPPLAPEVRQALLELYRDDILHLQDLLQRDLARWLGQRKL